MYVYFISVANNTLGGVEKISVNKYGIFMYFLAPKRNDVNRHQRSSGEGMRRSTVYSIEKFSKIIVLRELECVR